MSKTTYHPHTVYISFEERFHTDGYYAVPDTYPIHDVEVIGDGGRVVGKEKYLVNPLPRETEGVGEDELGDTILPDDVIFLSDDEDEAARLLALRLAIDEWDGDWSISIHDDTLAECGNRSYLVVTDDEADKKWDEDLNNYLDECVLPDLPENMRHYFDEDAWKRDARVDGRAHSLNRYDGNELWEEVNGETYYVYRQN